MFNLRVKKKKPKVIKWFCIDLKKKGEGNRRRMVKLLINNLTNKVRNEETNEYLHGRNIRFETGIEPGPLG